MEIYHEMAECYYVEESADQQTVTQNASHLPRGNEEQFISEKEEGRLENRRVAVTFQTF